MRRGMIRKKRYGFLVVMVVAVMALFGCADADVEQKALFFTPDTLPAIDGATVMTPYYEAMAAELMDLPIEEARQYVLCSKTDGAYEGLIAREADVIFTASVTEEQKQAARDAGFELELTPFLNDGFVFFVNQSNPVDSLTLVQVRDIYRGKIKNWKEVGGDDVPIVAYQRPDASGSQAGMYEHVLPQEEIMAAPTEKVIGEMMGIIDAVASYQDSAGAIGYSYYYFAANMYGSEKLKFVSIDGVVPDEESIATSEYPLTTPSYVVIRANEPENCAARDIVDWVKSPAGQQVARENGYIPRAE